MPFAADRCKSSGTRQQGTGRAAQRRRHQRIGDTLNPPKATRLLVFNRPWAAPYRASSLARNRHARGCGTAQGNAAGNRPHGQSGQDHRRETINRTDARRLRRLILPATAPLTGAHPVMTVSNHVCSDRRSLLALIASGDRSRPCGRLTAFPDGLLVQPVSQVFKGANKRIELPGR